MSKVISSTLSSKCNDVSIFDTLFFPENPTRMRIFLDFSLRVDSKFNTRLSRPGVVRRVFRVSDVILSKQPGKYLMKRPWSPRLLIHEYSICCCPFSSLNSRHSVTKALLDFRSLLHFLPFWTCAGFSRYKRRKRRSSTLGLSGIGERKESPCPKVLSKYLVRLSNRAAT